MEGKNITIDINDIIIRYGQEVKSIIRSYVRDDYAVEDIFQETCLKLLVNINNFEKRASIKTWFTRIAINNARDYLKSAYCKKVVPVIEHDENVRIVDDVYKNIEDNYERKMIRGIVRDLPTKYKDIIVCVYYRGYSVVDSSKLLEIAEGTARSRLKRAKDIIKREIEKNHKNELV